MQTLLLYPQITAPPPNLYFNEIPIVHMHNEVLFNEIDQEVEKAW